MQGKAEGFRGTCGLVSCVNVLRMAGLDISEQEMVDFASKTQSKIDGAMLCDTGYLNPADNGGTTGKHRDEILGHFGVQSVSLPATADDIARYVEAGHGVIISVHARQLYEGVSTGGDLHAVTVTATRRGADGALLGFYLCDSNRRPASYYSVEDLVAALSGRKMNVTSGIIR